MFILRNILTPLQNEFSTTPRIFSFTLSADIDRNMKATTFSTRHFCLLCNTLITICYFRYLALAGEEVIIAKSGHPLVKLVPVQRKRGRRALGIYAGKIKVHGDLMEPLPESIIRDF